MKISKHWLNEYLIGGETLSPDDIARELQMKTVEVERVEDAGRYLTGIVVGRVRAVAKHPDADRLVVCIVDIGKTVQIVCGGSNVREGMYVAVGLPGARVKWHGKGNLVELEETSIRGVASFGMICAADEISLADAYVKKEDKEILDLTHLQGIRPGQPLAEALGLGDAVFHIDNTSLSNRPDLWGHYGMAREVAAIFNIGLKEHPVEKIREGADIEVKVHVQDTAVCPRYMAIAVSDVAVAPSPAWMQDRLVSVGIRPVNNVVDITNYVMMDMGQPMHAFDADRVGKSKKQKAIIVRMAKSGETMTTLGGEHRALTGEMLIIADSGAPIAIAGVIGGSDTGVSEATRTILFEAATFDAVSVRRTATALCIRTESSARFEKSLDPYLPESALQKAVALLLQMCPTARVASRIADEKHIRLDQGPVQMPVSFVEDRIGAPISQKTAEGILSRLGFSVKKKRGAYHMTVPSWRATKDVTVPEDIVEEVARLYGYDNIPGTMPEFSIAPPWVDPLHELQSRIRDILAREAAYTEVYNYSFVSPEWLQKLGSDTARHVALANPIAKDRPLVRRSLIPNMLENVEKNLHRFSRVALFEIGRVCIPEAQGEEDGVGGRLPEQPTMLGLVVAERGNESPFYAASDAVRRMFISLGVPFQLCRYTSAPAPYMHPGRCAKILSNHKDIGTIAELHPAVQHDLGIETRVALAEIHCDAFLSFLSKESPYHPIPLYPPIMRDVACVVGGGVEHNAMVDAISRVSPLVSGVELIDVYTGKGVSQGEKSLTYRITYQSADRTLSSHEADAEHARIASMLKESFHARLRA